ncbi:MAG: hypothetical protein PWP16_1562 [Eubacteriaceae bacterium]|jgi:uncharacterized protein (DUF1810 family)|nr:hypothetical protein [Eubacteriaceae bacterium]MDK2962555.1 hypothetical protein [Eubacteriaceae bacterium]MDN5308199.1 hypothetical protein [Eubacteriaceae bacterium]
MEGLERFLKAQEGAYDQALREIKSGRKQSHWMWYIFPQIQGLGRSSMAKYYAIRDRDEAVTYFNDPVLGSRLIEISSALLNLESNDPEVVMGWPDNLKLKSSMTLFALVSDNPIFSQVLNKYFGGQQDEFTITKLKNN